MLQTPKILKLKHWSRLIKFRMENLKMGVSVFYRSLITKILKISTPTKIPRGAIFERTHYWLECELSNTYISNLKQSNNLQRSLLNFWEGAG